MRRIPLHVFIGHLQKPQCSSRKPTTNKNCFIKKKKIACFHIEQLQWETRTERFMNISLNIINS